MQQLFANDKINGIKIIRQLTGCDLREAKDAIDQAPVTMQGTLPQYDLTFAINLVRQAQQAQAAQQQEQTTMSNASRTNTAMNSGDQNQMSQALMVAILSKNKAYIIGEPGIGKTTLIQQVVETMLPGRWGFVAVDEGTAPKKLIGHENIPALLQGQTIMEYAGTLNDPQLMGFIIDELSRANDVVFDSILSILTRWSPWVGATSNWMPTNERQRAMMDRFDVQFTLKMPSPSQLPINAMMPTMIGSWAELDPAAVAAIEYKFNPAVKRPIKLPTSEEVAAVWKTAPTQADYDGIAAVLRDLAIEFEAVGFNMHPRKMRAAATVMHAISVLDTGKAGYGTPTKSAIKQVKWVLPSSLSTVLNRVADSAGDPNATMINAVRAQMAQVLKSITDKEQVDRMPIVADAGKQVNDLMAQLATIDDPRAKALKDKAQMLYMQAFQSPTGQDVKVPELSELADDKK